MLIRTSRTTGSVEFEMEAAPPRLVVEDGKTYLAISLTNVRGGTNASLMLRPEEIDRL